MRLVLLIICLLAATDALANNAGQILQGIGVIVSFWFPVAGLIINMIGGIYGSQQAQSAAEKAARESKEAARQSFNNALRDRTITTVGTDSPHVYVYGRARVGSTIPAMFTSGAKDEYKHLVCIHAAHECDAIEEIYINGNALGALDSNGDVTNGTYAPETVASVAMSSVNFLPAEMFNGNVWHLEHQNPIIASIRVNKIAITKGAVSAATPTPFTYDPLFNVITITSGIVDLYAVYYDYTYVTPMVRVTKHLGGAGDPADAALIAMNVGWLDSSTLTGLCYTVIRLNLNQPEFQGGIPPIEALLRGKKLYDMRTSTTAWSQNPALAVYDYLTSEMCGVPASDIPVADYITAANVCDELISIGNLVNAPRYVINGTITADQDQMRMLDALTACMAGGYTCTTWVCWAGKYIAPIKALDQSDIIGALSVISGTPDADLYNGVKGQYIGAENAYVVTDFTPYQNSAYVAADGGQQWNNIDFLFTDTAQRIWNLCRIYLEDQRLGFTVKAMFSLKCWSLRVGDRITLSSSFLGQTGAVYRITDKRFGKDQGVELTLKDDADTVWDLVDAATVQSTPATNLISPFSPMAAPGNFTVTEELYQTTGSVGIRTKATVAWDAIADSTIVGYELSYKPYATGVWIVYTLPLGTSFTLADPAPGMYDFKVRGFNNLGVYSAFTPMITSTLYGLTAAPADITGFGVLSMAGMAWCSWDKTPDLDVKIGGKVAIRHCALTTGATWEQSYLLEEFNGDATSGFVPLYTGTYYAKFVDSTGHYSDTAASFVATESYITGFTTVATTTQQPNFAGTKTNVFASGGVLALSNQTLVDDLPLIDSIGMWDSVGGIISSGTYDFDATVDLGSSASRRFFASLAMQSFDTGDMIDERIDLIDSWASFDGSVINDTDVTLFTRVSDDNITFGPWTPFMIADFKCRYAQFQAVLSTVSSAHNIAVSTLSVAIKTSP
jgi:hypothetical protein